MKPVDREAQKEIKIPANIYRMLEERAQKDGRDIDTLIKLILLDALAPSVAELGRRIGQQAEELGKMLSQVMSKSEDESADEPPELLN